VKRLTGRANTLLVAAVTLGLLLPAAARAQPDADAKSSAQAHFKQGRAFYDAGQHDAAIAEYRAGYEQTHWPGFLFNIGLAYEAEGNKREALAHYKRYLELDPKGEASDEAAEYVARLSQAIAEEDAQAAERRRREQLEIEARRAREQAATEARERAALARRARTKRRLRLAGLLTAGVGLVSLAAGTKFGVDARRASDDVSAHTDGAWPDSLIARYDEGVRDERLMFVFTGVGAAALVGGAVLYLFGRGEVAGSRNHRVSIRPSVGGDLAMLSLTGRF